MATLTEGDGLQSRSPGPSWCFRERAQARFQRSTSRRRHNEWRGRSMRKVRTGMWPGRRTSASEGERGLILAVWPVLDPVLDLQNRANRARRTRIALICDLYVQIRAIRRRGDRFSHLCRSREAETLRWRSRRTERVAKSHSSLPAADRGTVRADRRQRLGDGRRVRHDGLGIRRVLRRHCDDDGRHAGPRCAPARQMPQDRKRARRTAHISDPVRTG